MNIYFILNIIKIKEIKVKCSKICYNLKNKIEKDKENE